jgi:hypothetical protein
MRSRYRLASALSLPLAVLLALAAAGGIFVPAVYAREAPLWAAQGMGQDWVDLVLVAPLVAITAGLAWRGSHVAALLLAGALAYALYSLVLYAFFVHFGPLFPVYTAALGLAFYALVTLAFALAADGPAARFGPRAPARTVGAFTAAIGAAFYPLWLAEVVPALASGSIPKSVIEAGLVTNPVHVLDLGVVLPAFVAGGLALFARRPLGWWLGPTMLGFSALMATALAAMAVSMNARGFGAGSPPLLLFVALALASGGALVWLLSHLRGA